MDGLSLSSSSISLLLLTNIILIYIVMYRDMSGSYLAMSLLPYIICSLSAVAIMLKKILHTLKTCDYYLLFK